MSAFIYIEKPTVPNPRVELGNSTGIGRSTVNQLCYPEDTSISRQHALIRQQGENEFYLIDLGSSNGTYLNSQLLIGPTLLKNGDRIQVGDAVMVFELVGADQVDPTKASDETTIEQTMVAMRMSTMVILVCDIRAFTRISEILSPDQLAKLLGRWFRQISELINSRGGVVDKFIGDAVMAYWVVDQKNPIVAQESALTTAVDLHRMANEMRIEAAPDFKFQVGVGLNQGVVSCGNVGMKSQRDSTIMGDAVNMAFRLETVCKEKQMPIVVSAQIRDALADKFGFVSLGPVHLKGKSTPHEVFGLPLE